MLFATKLKNSLTKLAEQHGMEMAILRFDVGTPQKSL